MAWYVRELEHCQSELDMNTGGLGTAESLHCVIFG